MPLSLFRNITFTVSVAVGFFSAVGMFGTILFVPLLYQGVLGLSATNSGQLLTPMMFGLIVASVVSGQVITRVKRYRFVGTVGLSTMVLGMWLLSQVRPGATAAEAVRDIVLVGLGLGMEVFLEHGFVLREHVGFFTADQALLQVIPERHVHQDHALVASGLPAERWRFAGFLPRKRAELRALFAAPETLVAFESPRRVAASLAALAEADPDRPVAVCRELTKVHEEVVRGTAAELAARYGEAPPRGEVVLVVGPAAAEAEPDLGPALDALARLVEAGARTRPAASVVADLTGIPANRLYRALAERG